MTFATKGEPLPSQLRQQIADIVAAGGERAAGARLGISRQTLSRALAGLPLYRGTHAQIRAALQVKP